MFGLFKSIAHHHPCLRALQWKHGMWRGTIQLASQPVALALSGTRRYPDQDALATACAVPGFLSEWLPIIGKKLFEHYEPYLDAYRRGETTTVGEPFPLFLSPDGVWEHVRLIFLAADPIGGVMMAELGYEAGWYIEHILGARFSGREFVELNGSVGRP